MNDSPATLASLTTIRVGGPAERLLIAHTRDELIEHARDLWDEGEDWLLLGGGSNTVVSDEGFPGAVLLVRNEGIEAVDDPIVDAGRVRVRVQAGQDWDALVATCLARGWNGLEALSGIPGLAGAAPIQNIGAYGTELSDVLHSIELLEADTGEVARVGADELALSYRDSALKRGDLHGVVLSIDLLLDAAPDEGGADEAPVRYAQLADALGVSVGDRAPARTIRDTVLRLRSSKGMVLDAVDHDTWSCGSFFTNPIVSEHFARSLPADAPRFPVGDEDASPVVIPLEHVHEAGGLDVLNMHTFTPERRVKLSAAWLIEHAGVHRGFRLPGSGAAISSKHTLAITNRGGATAADVAQLARYVIAMVQSEFGVVLAPEPNLYGLEL